MRTPFEHGAADWTVDDLFPEAAAHRHLRDARGDRLAPAADEAREIDGSTASITSRTRRATTGDDPPVPTATTTSPRSTMAGKMNVE
jgi:hypothetical protein